MLIKVTRHGFIFWEAVHCLKPPFEELSPRAALFERIREKAKAFANTIPIDFSNGSVRGEGNANGNGSGGSAAKFMEREKKLKEIRNRYNPRTWGDLVQFADEPAAGSPEEEQERELLGASSSSSGPGGDGGGRSVFIAIEDVQERVIAAFGVAPRRFFGRKRARKLALARTASMALCQEHTYCSGEEIAAAHGKSPTVAARASAKARVIRSVNAEFAAAYEKVEGSLRAAVKKAA